MRNGDVSHTFLLLFSGIIGSEVGYRCALLITILCIEKKNKSLNKFVLFLYVFYMNKAPPNIFFSNY